MPSTRPPSSSGLPLRDAADRIVAALGGHWYAGGAICRCPAHDDHRPSLSIRLGERRLLFKCFAGCTSADILAALQKARLSTGAERGPHERGTTARDGASIAQNLWRRGRSVAGTPAELYLSSRGLPAPHPAVRYLARTPLGTGPARRQLAAMLIAVEDETGIIAVQRLFLDPLTGAKTDMEAPRRTLGRLGGGAVRLAPAAQQLGLAEGYETARAAEAMLGIPVWASLGAERLHAIALPSIVERVILLPDRDAAGARAADRASKAYAGQERSVDIRLPPAGVSDWAELLTAQR